jgi:hypothetical protein
MKPGLQVVTLAVNDLEPSLKLYREGPDWSPLACSDVNSLGTKRSRPER